MGVGLKPATSRSIRKMRSRMRKPVGLSKEEGRVVVDGSDGRAGTIPEPKWIEQFQVQVTITITIVVVECMIRPGALCLYHHCMSICDASTSHVEVLMSDVVGSKVGRMSSVCTSL